MLIFGYLNTLPNIFLEMVFGISNTKYFCVFKHHNYHVNICNIGDVWCNWCLGKPFARPGPKLMPRKMWCANLCNINVGLNV